MPHTHIVTTYYSGQYAFDLSHPYLPGMDNGAAAARVAQVNDAAKSPALKSFESGFAEYAQSVGQSPMAATEGFMRTEKCAQLYRAFQLSVVHGLPGRAA